VAPWSARIELRGAGGEPVDFARTLLSHGVADLPPNQIEPDGSRLRTALTAGGRTWMAELGQDSAEAGVAVLSTPVGAPTAPRELAGELVAQLRHMLRLDENLTGFYTLAAGDPQLAWVTVGAGRMLRSPTVFEDLVKTICTTNCAWSATERMVGALVGELGMAAEGAPGAQALPTLAPHGTLVARAFPTPEAMADAGEDFYRDVARSGYRGAYLRALAEAVADGRLELESLADPELPDVDVAERLLSLAGVGPYAMAHMMMLLGRYRRLILDSWTRPKYRRLTGRSRITDKGITRAFARYRDFAGLAFWLTLTEDWIGPAEAGLAEGAAPPPRTDPPAARQ
jgi:N-glycosylase/DNA lyase